jgi:hypothetical protein
MLLQDIKPAISTRKPVSCNGVDYYITACIMRLVNGEWRYSLELHDMAANSVTVAAIEDVMLKENENA